MSRNLAQRFIILAAAILAGLSILEIARYFFLAQAPPWLYFLVIVAIILLVNEARWLAGHFPIHAMIDLSDGLAGDLRHLLDVSGVGAELHKSAVPISRAAKLASKAGDAAKPAFVAALTDGEDFELLFTVASRHAVPLLDAWKKKFSGLRLTCIGRIIEREGIRLRDKTGVRPFTAHGYIHFS